MSALKILIVEDEILIAEDISSRLKKAGYEVLDIVSNGVDALSIVRSDNPDIIIMDIQLRGSKKNGVDIAKELRERQNTPIIFLTNSTDRKMVNQATSVGSSTYLLKPFNEMQLIVSIQQALYNAAHLNPKIDNVQSHLENYYFLNNCLFIRLESNHFTKIYIDDILFIESDGAYAHIHTMDNKYTYSISLNNLYDRMSIPSFIRVSRFHVVNLEKVDGIKGKQLLVKGREILIGDSFKEDVLKHFPILK